MTREFSERLLVRAGFGQAPIERFTPWLAAHPVGSLIFIGVWVGGSIACLPSTPLWLLGGFAFKEHFWVGLGLNVAGCWLGSFVCFGLGASSRPGLPCGGWLACSGLCC